MGVLAEPRRNHWRATVAAMTVAAILLIVCGCRSNSEGPQPAPESVAQVVGVYALEECAPPFVSLFGTLPADFVPLSPEPIPGLADGITLVSASPLFGRLSIAAGTSVIEAGLVLDETRGTEAGYDVIVVDTNGDGQLADEAPCYLAGAPGLGERRGAPSSEPYVDVAGPGGETRRVYFALEDAVVSAPLSGAIGNFLPEQRVALAARAPQARWASVPLGDRSVSVVAVDNDGDGRYGPWASDAFLLGGCKAYRAPDVLCVDHDGNGQLDVDLSTLYPGELLVGSLLSTQNRMLQLEVSETGDEIRVLTPSGALATLLPPEGVRINAVLSSVTDASRFFVVRAEAGGVVSVTADSYGLPLCRMAAADSGGRVWILTGGDAQLYAVGGSMNALVITPDMSTVPFGPPLHLQVDVAVFGRDAYLSPSLVGVGGRHWSLLVDNQSPEAPPSYRIRDATGQIVGEGTFPVLHGLPERVLWHGPTDAPPGAYTVEASWQVGPYPWSAPQPQTLTFE